jgi:hypothetical protein
MNPFFQQEQQFPARLAPGNIDQFHFRFFSFAAVLKFSWHVPFFSDGEPRLVCKPDKDDVQVAELGLLGCHTANELGAWNDVGQRGIKLEVYTAQIGSTAKWLLQHLLVSPLTSYEFSLKRAT